jgi:flavin reductase (DIM6/NTAB) family NADH-FMN oxidoreductase RutF
MPVDPLRFRRAMRRWASGVTIVTVEHAGIRHGMTVNSFTSISLTPPRVLVSLERVTRTHGLVKEAGAYGVEILSAGQQAISERFAGQFTENGNRFADLETYTLVTGAPFIPGGIGYLDCQVIDSYEIATHTLFIGEVLAVKIGGPDQPLLYYNRLYRTLQD